MGEHHRSKGAARPKRPSVDAEIDGVLAEHLTPGDHRIWWHAEHALLHGLTAKEALDAGERRAVIKAARLRPGAGPQEPVITEARATEIRERLPRS